jgi:hypothetical protein
MTDELDNLILVYLRRLDAKLDSMIEVLADNGRRLTSLEIAVANLAPRIEARPDIRGV